MTVRYPLVNISGQLQELPIGDAVTASSTVILHALNQTGVTIAKGAVVYVSGANGDNPTLTLASASTEIGSSSTIGFVTATTTTGSICTVLTNGLFEGVDTSSTTAGASVWLSTVAGQVTFGTPPTQPTHSVFLGKVIRVQSNNGSIFVAIQNGYELTELHDVLITSAANNNLLAYESSSALWKNVSAINGVSIGATTPSTGVFSSITKSGGTSSQFLKADGSVDSTAYLQPATNTLTQTLALTANLATTGVTITQSGAGAALRLTQSGTGNTLVVEDSTNPDSTPFVIANDGRQVIGHTSISGYWYSSANTLDHIVVSNSSNAHGHGAINYGGEASYALFRSRGVDFNSKGLLLNGDGIGKIVFAGEDGVTNGFLNAAFIGAAVDAAPATGSMPTRLTFSTSATGSSTPTERMRIDSAGRVGIGGTPTASVTLSISKSMSGNPTQLAIKVEQQIKSDVTAVAQVFRTSPYTEAANFTLPYLYHYVANQGSIGSGSTISVQFGISAESNLTGATVNYGIYSTLANTVDSNSTVARTVQSISITSNVVTVTTTAAHGYTTGQLVTMAVGSVTAGSFVVGATYLITAIGTTDFTLIGASANTVGTSFVATDVGTGTGTAKLPIDGSGLSITVTTSTAFTYARTTTNNAGNTVGGTVTPSRRYNFYAGGTAPNYFAGNTTFNSAVTINGLATFNAAQTFPEPTRASIRPSLLLDFANSKTLDPRITFSRASTATYFGKDGLLKTAASGSPRFDYAPITGESLGLLIEEQRTTLLTYSEQFDNAVWTKNDSTITANSAIAPDGTMTADKLVQNNANTTHLVKQGATTTNTNPITATVYVKAAERTNVTIQIQESTTFSRYAFCTIDLIAGTSGIVTVAGGASSASSSCTPIVNGWHKCSLTVTLGGTDPNSQLVIIDGTSLATYTGDGTSGIYIWGAQLEVGAFPTSYIKTTTAQATRLADNVSMSGTNFSSWYRQDEGTVVCENTIDNIRNYNPRIFCLSNGTDGTKLVAFLEGNTNNYRLGYTNNYITQVNFNPVSSGHTIGSVTKLACSYKVDNINACTNGGTISTDTSCTLATFNVLSFDDYNSGAFVSNCHIKRFAYYPKQLTNSELISLSTV